MKKGSMQEVGKARHEAMAKAGHSGSAADNLDDDKVVQNQGTGHRGQIAGGEPAGANVAARAFSVRGGIFVGKVKSAKAPLTVTVEKKIVKYVQKFERYKKDRARIKAHNPPGINAKEGDIVRCGETRKISKTKSFVVLGIIKKGESK